VRHSGELTWPSVFLVICLALIALVKIRWFQKFSRILQSVFSRQLQQQLEREEISPFRFYWLALNLLLILNLAFLCWKVNSLEGLVLSEATAVVQFLFFFAIILLLFTGRYLMDRVVAQVTGTGKLMAEYGVNSSLVNHCLGVVIFPLAMLAEFSPFEPYIFIYISVFIILLAFLLKWYRGLRKGLAEEHIGILQIFSYFCALEILPVSVLVKYIIITF
jgi:hypothetical protein